MINPCGRSSAVGKATSLVKRRKVRKGTQSCWECKRRKIRCTFATSKDTICDGCRSRQTKCVSQEFHNEAAVTNRRLDKISHMGQFVEGNAVMSNAISQDLPKEFSNNKQLPDVEYAPPDANSQLSPPTAVTAHCLSSASQTIFELDDVYDSLVSAWPTQEDLDIILSLQVGTSVLFHGLVCRPYSDFFAGQMASPQTTLRLPPYKSHPVLIARKLLLLCTFLQGISSEVDEKLAGLSSDHKSIMSRAFHAATRLVTTNDELVGSIEGIECIMIESMYQNNAGNLRRAWLANRRAMVMAQMMGLHAGLCLPNIFLENGTRERIDPDYMWCRLVCSDRYLSLMLGLPQATSDNNFASPQALESCQGLERMERLEVVAAGLILQRNVSERTNLQMTQEADKLLQEAAKSMPPKWWSTMSDIGVIARNDGKAFEETIRLMSQFAHYNLVLQLHLPYMLLPSCMELNYDYNKMTAANASRTILTQFVSFRTSTHAPAYCRGIDFIAFNASTALCLAHMEACCQQTNNLHKGVTAFQSLRHQRLSDRGLLEHTLEVMDTMAQSIHDVVALEVSNILRSLLDIENKCFAGGRYIIRIASENEKRESRYLANTNEESHSFRISIPYLGIITIEHHATTSNTMKDVGKSSEQHLSQDHTSRPMGTNYAAPIKQFMQPITQEERDLMSTASPVGYEISASQPTNSDWQSAPSYTAEAGLLGQSESEPIGDRVISLENNNEQPTYLLVPGLTADVDDWALQGVDMTFFNSLIHGSAGPAQPSSPSQPQ